MITQTDYRRLYYNAAQNSSRTSNRQIGGESGNKRFRYVDGGVDGLCCCGGSYQAAAEEEEVKYKVMIACLVALIVVCCSCSVALAESATPSNFDGTSVMADLNGATIDGKLFDIADYPLGEDKVPQLLQFAEYGFSTIMDLQHNYGLYFYFYNPSGKEIDPNYCEVLFWLGAKKNDGDFEYENCALELLSISADNVFAKFKLTEHVSDTYNRVAMTPASREYHIAGIQIRYKGELNAVDYTVGGTWFYSGYGEGLATESQNGSTLVSTSSPLTVVDLDVQFTYYRSWQTLENADQLSAVYFSIDKSFDSQYDDLYSIQAEYYTFLTSPIFCVFDKAYFIESDLLVDYDKLWSDLQGQVGVTMDGTSGRSLYWGPSYSSVYNNQGSYAALIELNKMAWLSQVTSGQNFALSSDALLTYMQQYSANRDKTVLNKYSSDLFANKYLVSGGSSYVSGYKQIDLSNSGEDDFALVGSSVKINVWKALFGNKQWEQELKDIQPIVKVSYDDVKNLSDEELVSKYFIAPEEILRFRTYLQLNENKVTYLFRFSKDLYYTSQLGTNYGLTGGQTGAIGFAVQQPVFLNFDVISLGYKKDGVVNIIPVVSNPKDFIGSAEAGQDIHDYLGEVSEMFTQLLTILFGIVLLAVAVFCIAWALKVIFRKR